MKALVLNFLVIFLVVSCQQEEFFEKDLSAIYAPDIKGTIVDGGEVKPDNGKDEGKENETEKDDDTEVIPQIPLEPSKPIVVKKKDCGHLKHGESEERTKFQNSTVAYGSQCKQEVQVRSCFDGNLSNWTGSYKFDSCKVEAAKNCGDVKHGTTTARTRYEEATVSFGKTCKQETQTATCDNGKLSDWSGSYQYETCEIAAAKDCGDVRHGETTSRVRYETATVEFGKSCKSEVQKAVCDNGTLTGFNGNFKFDSCQVDSQKVKRVTETFRQNSASENKVDILWVIDDSGSMEDDQIALANNFNAFIKDFIAKDIDFKMGITTTDNSSPRTSGVSKCDLNLLTSDRARINQGKFIADFKRCVHVGDNGHWKESGLATSLNFFKKYQSNFVRDDAKLVTIFVSDENDQSNLKRNDYVEKVLQATNKVSKRGNFVAYAIENPYAYDYNDPYEKRFASSNKPSWWEALFGQEKNLYYKDVAEITGGKVGDIQSDFARTLTDLGQAIVNLAESFKLNRLPYDDEIVVTVDGEVVTTGWTIDVKSGSLRFDDAHLPRVGAEVTITYNALIN